MAARKIKVPGAEMEQAKAASPYITVTETLKKRIATAHTARAKLDTEYHLLAVSAMLHVAEHGNPAVIQELYDGLSANYQTGFKGWLSRYASDMAEPNGLGEGNGFLRFKAKKFEVINGRTDQRNAFKARIDDVFNAKPFYAYRLDNGVKAFGPDEVLNRLASLIKTMEKDDNKASFDPIQVTLLQSAYKQFSATVPLDVVVPAAPAQMH